MLWTWGQMLSTVKGMIQGLTLALQWIVVEYPSGVSHVVSSSKAFHEKLYLRVDSEYQNSMRLRINTCKRIKIWAMKYLVSYNTTMPNSNRCADVSCTKVTLNDGLPTKHKYYILATASPQGCCEGNCCTSLHDHCKHQ